MSNSDSTQSVTREQLAKLLGVTPDAVSRASENNQLCEGYPVAEWAEITTRGEIVSYHVPEKILAGIASKMASGRLTQASKRLDKVDSNNGLIKLVNGFIKMVIGLLKIIPTGVKMGLIKPERIGTSHQSNQKKMDNPVSYTLDSKNEDR